MAPGRRPTGPTWWRQGAAGSAAIGSLCSTLSGAAHPAGSELTGSDSNESPPIGPSLTGSLSGADGSGGVPHSVLDSTGLDSTGLGSTGSGGSTRPSSTGSSGSGLDAGSGSGAGAEIGSDVVSSDVPQDMQNLEPDGLTAPQDEQSIGASPEGVGGSPA